MVATGEALHLSTMRGLLRRTRVGLGGSILARTRKQNAARTKSVMRSRLRWGAAVLIVAPLLMWLLVRLDWLRADSLRLAPPLVLIGIALLAAERSILSKRGGQL